MTTRTSISTRKPHSHRESIEAPHFGSEQSATALPMSELNKKFFYNPSHTPRKMAEYAARRSPLPTRNKAGSFQVSRSASNSHPCSVSASVIF